MAVRVMVSSAEAPELGPPWLEPGRATKRVRQMAAIVLRDEPDGVWRCRYCRRTLPAVDRPWIDDGTGTWPVRDHVVPRARGGSDLLDNLALACTHCNVRKGDFLLEELSAGWWLTSATAG